MTAIEGSPGQTQTNMDYSDSGGNMNHHCTDPACQCNQDEYPEARCPCGNDRDAIFTDEISDEEEEVCISCLRDMIYEAIQVHGKCGTAFDDGNPKRVRVYAC